MTEGADSFFSGLEKRGKIPSVIPSQPGSGKFLLVGSRP
jgi:hypothetical protein